MFTYILYIKGRDGEVFSPSSVLWLLEKSGNYFTYIKNFLSPGGGTCSAGLFYVKTVIV